MRRVPPWFRVAFAMFGIGWGANQFVALIIAYRELAGVSVASSQALFGVYALGLIAALLIGGPISDRRGRARVIWPALACSVAATAALLAGAHQLGLLYLGRLLAGVASGGAFAAGTAWVKELSRPPIEPHATDQDGARRAALALSLGFGLGPVVAGVVAQWAPRPLELAYLPHLAVMIVALPLLAYAPETVATATATTAATATAAQRSRLIPTAVSKPRFVGVVGPAAPWTFLAPSTAFAVLPGLVASHTHGLQIAFAAASAGLTLSTGVFIQPLARRLDARGGTAAFVLGLASGCLGFVLAALAAYRHNPLLAALAAIPLGASYGACLVGGLLESERLADPGELASLVAIFYALTYVGFAGPLVYAELTAYTSYPDLLIATAALAAFTAAAVSWRSARHPRAPAPPHYEGGRAEPDHQQRHRSASLGER